MKLIRALARCSVFATVSLKDATFKIKGGGSEELTVKVGDGNITFDPKRNIEYKLDRGEIDEVREGDDVPMDVNFTFNWLYSQPGSGYTGNEVIQVEDAIKGVGTASSWTSADPDTCRPYAVDLEITLTAGCAGRSQVITMADFRWESMPHDLKAGQVSCSGKCNAKDAVYDHN